MVQTCLEINNQESIIQSMSCLLYFHFNQSFPLLYLMIMFLNFKYFKFLCSKPNSQYFLSLYCLSIKRKSKQVVCKILVCPMDIWYVSSCVMFLKQLEKPCFQATYKSNLIEKAFPFYHNFLLNNLKFLWFYRKNITSFTEIWIH